MAKKKITVKVVDVLAWTFFVAVSAVLGLLIMIQVFFP